MNVALAFVLVLITLLLILTIMMVLPFLQFFLLAALLAYLFLPIQRRLEPRVGKRLAAGSIVLIATAAVVLPLLYFGYVAIQEAVDVLEGIQEGDIGFDALEGQIEEMIGVDIDLMDQLAGFADDIALGGVVSVLDTVTHLILGAALTLFLLYYFLKDRAGFMHWLRRTAPLDDQVQDRLYDKIDGMMKAVLLGHVFVAFLQGILAGLGLFATGIPNATLWTGIMIVLSFLPLVGSFLVWGPAAVWLFVNNDPILAAGLFVWGATVVGVSDDYVRPVVVDRYASVNPSVIIIGVFGGIYVLGFMGIFFGPIIIGMLRVTLDVFREEFDIIVTEGPAVEASEDASE